MPEKLKPCPFCGGQAQTVWIKSFVRMHNVNMGGFAIQCAECHATRIMAGPVKKDVEKDAIEKWNRRITEQIPEE